MSFKETFNQKTVNVKRVLNQKTTDFCKNSSGEDMTFKEVMGYSVAGFGQNLICGLIASFLAVFMTDALGFGAPGLTIWGITGANLVAYLMLGTRLFDAFNDPIMGSLVDRTRTKYGKCRPYLKWMPIPIAIMTTLCFLPFYPANATGFLIISVVYVVWSITYTIVDVPYWGLSTAMSNDTDLRGKLLMVARLFCTVGGGIVTILIPMFSGMKYFETNPDSLKYFFFGVAAIISVVSIPLFLYGFRNTKERYVSDKPAPSLRHNLGLLFKNKPLLLIVTSGILGCARTVYTGVAMIYFTKYALQQESLFSIVTMLIIPGGLVASVLCPFLQRKFGKKWTYIATHFAGGIVMFIMYFVGWDSTAKLVVGAIGLVLLGIPQGINNIMCYAMIGDSVDYLEYKTGERGEGICFAMQTLINKIGMAATAFIGVIVYAPAMINPDLITIGKPDLLWDAMILTGAISMIACCIPMLFYTFTEKKQREVVKIIKERRELALEKSEEVSEVQA